MGPFAGGPVKLHAVWRRLTSGYWFVPTAIVATAVGLALVLLEIDARLDGEGSRIGFTGSPDSARELLAVIASSTLTLTALVFSVTVIVLQLASGQFSPRVLRTFLRDRRNQATLGVFLATFVYAIVVVREIRGSDGPADGFVPGLAVTTGFALAMLAIALFVQYIHNIANSIRVIEIIERITRETAAAADRAHPLDLPAAAPPPTGPPATVVRAASGGVVLDVDVDRLAAGAEGVDGRLTVVPRIGDFVATDSPLVLVHHDGRRVDVDLDDERMRRAFSFGKERELDDDPAFGFRQLVDIAERALSPGVNDPTTATQVLDHLHDLLRRLLPRSLPAWRHDDTRRVVLSQYTWDDYVHLALDEIRHWGADSLQVHRRIATLLDDLLADANPDRAQVLIEQRQFLDVRRPDADGPSSGGPGRW